MIQQGAAIDASAVELRGIDVETLGVGEMTASLKGADGLVIAVGFVPGNPFKMTAAGSAGSTCWIEAAAWVLYGSACAGASSRSTGPTSAAGPFRV